ncbi:hypothetical protein Dsin_025827 [Dipteronia sinensis]|uniref:Uncharacterized protein n=1 Tax=Dipteronia sinensis TaxID=43782 RepID=A0AAD9ZX22_9ROSI|nr:hypothetical protein Dsin_025827 [Dipteronia sinensis]
MKAGFMRMGEAVVSSEGAMEMEMEREMEMEKEKNGSSKVVRWEKFMPRTVLRVLLVEADDSTRHIITALLRKCSYRVSAVPDGLMAWEALKCQPHNIDLVLTEVDLPSISGFTLLTLVMEHDICKNIPVIMMSSHDSISIVLKCMLKGAADFLIKPVRRNELRNLWQHVWRRQNLLGGHEPQNSPVLQRKSEATSENNASSNHSSDDAASTQKNKERSEKGSDVQSSCTSPYLEAEGACVQNMQGLSHKCRSASNLSNIDMEKHDEHVKLEKESVKPEIKFGEKLDSSGSEVALSSDAHTSTASGLDNDSVCVNTSLQGDGVGPESDIGDANDELIEPTCRAIDLIGTFNNHPKYSDGQFIFNDGISKFEFDPHLELSLRNFFPSSSKDQGADERHTLNHSTASAFSRYDNSKTSSTPFIKFTELKDGSSISSELVFNQLYENATGNVQPRGAPSSNMTENLTSPVIGQSGQAEVIFPSPQLGFSPVSGVRFDNTRAGYTQVFPPIFYTHSGLPPAWSPKSPCQREQSPFPTCTSAHTNPDIYGLEQGYQRGDGTTSNSIDQAVCEQKDVELLEEMRQGSPAAGQSACSSLCNGLGNNDNNCTDGGLCSRIDETATLTQAINKGTAPESMDEGTLFSHDRFRGTDSHRSSQREAALTKFRLKRKDRCFEKKVRYQSRKKLAEQRPRVKGQFVRQMRNDTTTVANGAGS